MVKFFSFDKESEAIVLRDFKMIVEDIEENEMTANENEHQYLNEETEQIENHLQNEKNGDQRNHEIEQPNKEIDHIKQTILNELGVYKRQI